MTRVIRYLLVVGGSIAGILLFLLASAAGNSAFFDRHYSLLLGLNLLMASALLALVLVLLARLYRRYRAGRFGSRLMTRLVVLFALIGILPGTVIYLVSVQFVTRSIDSWFDVRVESALEAGINLSRTALDSSLVELRSRASSMALELSDLSEAEQVSQLSRMRDPTQQQEALIVTANGRVVASVGSTLGMLLPDLPTASMLYQARMTRAYAAIEGGSDPFEERGGAVFSDVQGYDATPLRLRVVTLIPSTSRSLSLQSEARFLQLMQPVPAQLAANAEASREAYSEYQERSLARAGLRKIYLVTLTLTLLLAIFGAMGAAFVIASNLAKPLLLLAEGTKAVAEGNLSPRPIVASSDELGTLTKSFNAMTRQLAEARAAVEQNRAELENAKAYLESVLANMSAGVMVLDDQFRLVTCNESVERILQQDFDAHIGKPLANIAGLQKFSQAIIKSFSEQNAHSIGDESAWHDFHWQQQINIPRKADDNVADDDDSDITLLARGSRLPVDNAIGHVVVFDDISDVISAQRSIAWGEVARRLAHEIKNPLTPIQLSAERLQMKLEDKLSPPDAAILNKASNTIVTQVAALKQMVDNFRDYARRPPALLRPLDLNTLVEDVLGLYLNGDDRDIIHPRLASGLPPVIGDPTQLRQVIHNLLQNAQDAVHEQVGEEPPRIELVTEAVHYQTPENETKTAVRLSIVDNGPGFSPKILNRAFEPYVTSKSKGTGLGLAVVKKIIEEHGGRIDLQNRSTRGARVSVLLLKLAETL